MLTIQILIDNPDSWIIPYAELLIVRLSNSEHKVSLKFKHDDISKGDILCLLSCEKKFKNLYLNNHNIVVHESDLPKGKGWSPLTWQVLEGKNEIPITLFEAAENIDSGLIYLKRIVKLDGTELLNELRIKQGQATIDLIEEFIERYPNNVGKKQEGESTYYKRRELKDSELDINKSIIENFNILRVSDTERYPAYFLYKNCKYILKIVKLESI